MKDEFILDFDPLKTTQDRFNVEVHVNMRVNGREMFNSVDHSIEYPVVGMKPMQLLKEAIDKSLGSSLIFRNHIRIVLKSKTEVLGRSITIPVYPQEFVGWFDRLLPRLTQPKPKRKSALNNWHIDHCMPAIGGGIIWPDITIYGKNDMVFIQERPFSYAYPKHVKLMTYTECVTMVVSKRCFIDGVKQFIDKIYNTMSFIEDRDCYI